MKATYKGKVADVWQVSKDNRNSPDWVKEAFAKRYFCWLDNHLRVLTAGLKPSTVKNLKTGAIGSLGGGFAGYGMYELAYLGDYIDITNRRIIAQKTFEKGNYLALAAFHSAILARTSLLMFQMKVKQLQEPIAAIRGKPRTISLMPRMVSGDWSPPALAIAGS